MIIAAAQPRSGSSMLMRMLMLGGVEIEFDTKRDNPDAMKKFRNIHGFFEKTKFTKPTEDDKCFKAMSPAVIKPRPYAKFIFMQREPEQIHKSWEAVGTKRPIEMIQQGQDAWLKDLMTVQHLILNYDEVHADPIAACKQIADFIAPHPFDVEKAASAVDTTLYKRR